jgi:uncharacterized protein YdbL (DUF1318 family)
VTSPVRYGRSFFGDLESRLARLFDLSGAVSPEPQIDRPLAVVVAADASGPGYGGVLRGRQFSIDSGILTPGGAAAQFYVQAQVDLVLTGMRMQATAGGTGEGFQIRHYGSQDALANTPVAGVGTLFERARTFQELAPALGISAAAVAMTGGSQLFFGTQAGTTAAGVATALSSEFLFPLVLGAGCTLGVANFLTTSSNVRAFIRGYVL